MAKNQRSLSSDEYQGALRIGARTLRDRSRALFRVGQITDAEQLHSAADDLEELRVALDRLGRRERKRRSTR